MHSQSCFKLRNLATWVRAQCTKLRRRSTSGTWHKGEMCSSSLRNSSEAVAWIIMALASCGVGIFPTKRSTSLVARSGWLNSNVLRMPDKLDGEMLTFAHATSMVIARRYANTTMPRSTGTKDEALSCFGFSSSLALDNAAASSKSSSGSPAVVPKTVECCGRLYDCFKCNCLLNVCSPRVKLLAAGGLPGAFPGGLRAGGGPGAFPGPRDTGTRRNCCGCSGTGSA
mmetsp:Transcript_35545/g.102394  ORF Transcript_35545/g.102394 Transcript_35545/m.102394 type:complete len:227 (+) Transcript_35545:1206-1886(+)